MAVSKRLRFEILRRDNHACHYCGGVAPDVILTVDHVVPVALGGSDDPANLVAACKDCNAGKSSVPAGAPLVASVAEDALRWSLAMRTARDMALADQEQANTWCECFADHWNVFTVTVPSYKGGDNEPHTVPLPFDWRTTISALAADGMFMAEMRDAINIAMARNPDDRFSYFVGIIRNKIRDRQQVARDLLDRGEV